MCEEMYVTECMQGANGPMTRDDVIKRIAGSLGDYVYECLDGEGLLRGEAANNDELRRYDHRLRAYVQRLIAIRMISQYDYDEKAFVAAWGDEIGDGMAKQKLEKENLI